MSTLVLSPVSRFAERARRLPQPIDDRLRDAASRLPGLPGGLRTARLMAVGRNAVADHGTDPAVVGDRLRDGGMTRAGCMAALGVLRHVARRTLGVTPHDEQVAGAYGLLRGSLVEMATGEGKTLTAALAVGAAALAGRPVHVVTVNDYLASRDAEVLAPFYDALGLTVGLVRAGDAPDARRAAYACAVTFTSNKELGFDYLRDQIARRAMPSEAHRRLARLATPEAQGGTVMRGLHWAVVDEADSVLIDEARTPLLISAQAGEADRAAAYAALATARSLRVSQDFVIDRQDRRVILLPAARARLAQDGRRGLEDVTLALSALHVFKRDEHYLVRDGRVMIVDEYTGRVMPDRFWNGALHGLVEAKEGCTLSGRRDTLARISFQRLFPRYRHLCGMTGTAREAAREMAATYGLRVVRVPTHRPVRRRSVLPRAAADAALKWADVAAMAAALSRQGRPVLVGTRTVAAAAAARTALLQAGLDPAMLTAAQDEAEAQTVAGAGQPGRVTIATNMAGRGTDIRLGTGVAGAGGLAVILTERHDAGRIDRQLAGRCARQGEPGSVHRIVSLDDPLLAPLAARWSGRVALQLARHSGRFAWALCGTMQRRAERQHAAIRRQLARSDLTIEMALSFAGRME